MEKLAQQNQSVEVSRAMPHVRHEHRDISIFFGNITTFRPTFRDGKLKDLELSKTETGKRCPRCAATHVRHNNQF